MNEIEDVRGQVVRAIDDQVRLGTLPVSELTDAADAVMTIIARLLAARDAATVEDLRAWQESHQEQVERRNRAENRAERAEAELAAANERAVRAKKMHVRDKDAHASHYERIEAELAVAQGEIAELDRRLDRIREMAETAGQVRGAFGLSYRAVNAARLLDIVGPPAERGQGET
jgi:DNA repair exonuclease SbcCD ATPase subunit